MGFVVLFGEPLIPQKLGIHLKNYEGNQYSDKNVEGEGRKNYAGGENRTPLVLLYFWDWGFLIPFRWFLCPWLWVEWFFDLAI